VGWALGVERVLELLREQSSELVAPVPDAYAVIPDTVVLPYAMQVLGQLRHAGVAVQMHASTDIGAMGSMKSQFKKADASGARFALIFGADEVAQGQVTLKALRDGQGEQKRLHVSQVALWATDLQSKQ
jgi:histidyl-tRNA synthetase